MPLGFCSQGGGAPEPTALVWAAEGRVTLRSLVSLPRGLRAEVGFPSPANQKVALCFHLPLIIFAKCLEPCLAQRKRH